MDYSPPGFSIHGVFQARKQKWVAISFSKGSSWPRDQTCPSCIAWQVDSSPLSYLESPWDISCLTAATAITAVRHVIETVTVLYKWILEALKIQSLWTRGKFMWTTSSCLPVSAIRVQFWIHSTGSWLISWYWMLYSCLSATWCEELTHQKSPWCWERLKVAAEGHDRGWNGWMASLTRWAWIWASSRSWWWTGKPGVL